MTYKFDADLKKLVVKHQPHADDDRAVCDQVVLKQGKVCLGTLELAEWVPGDGIIRAKDNTYYVRRDSPSRIRVSRGEIEVAHARLKPLTTAIEIHTEDSKWDVRQRSFRVNKWAVYHSGVPAGTVKATFNSWRMKFEQWIPDWFALFLVYLMIHFAFLKRD